MKSFVKTATLAAALCFVTAPSHAAIIAVDYDSWLAGATQSNPPPQSGSIIVDPSTGITFTSPYLSSNSLWIQNLNGSGFTGASVTINLPDKREIFGVNVSSSAHRNDKNFLLEFFAGALSVGTGIITMPVGQGSPGPFTKGAFRSTELFDSVVLTAPTNGYMRIRSDSVLLVPVPGPAALALLGVGLLGLAVRHRRLV